jgi:hypothetical protein
VATCLDDFAPDATVRTWEFIPNHSRSVLAFLMRLDAEPGRDKMVDATIFCAKGSFSKTGRNGPVAGTNACH